MKIKAVKLYENGFMTQALAFGGEGMDGIDPTVKYRSSLQNYVIETGDEVILVDTGMPSEVPDAVPDEKTTIYMGAKLQNYVDALAAVGYKPEQVTKILITHKHADHTGELRNFPNAKIYASAEETKADELKFYPNVIPVEFTDGAYANFEKSQKIADGVYFIEAKGHTTGNSIVIVEDGGLYYMIHGDVTYTDEALYANKLSVVFEDIDVRTGDMIVVWWTEELPEQVPSGPSDSGGIRVFNICAGSADNLPSNNGTLVICDNPALGSSVIDAVVYSNYSQSHEGFGTRSALERARWVIESGAWSGDAVDSTSSTATRSMGRLPGFPDTDGNRDWIVTVTGGSTFGAANTAEAY